MGIGNQFCYIEGVAMVLTNRLICTDNLKVAQWNSLGLLKSGSLCSES